ncbi:sialidase family protein [Streptomyces sp. 8N114]|uniref:sialidase family protein n=1 Tax=Streptomyces sp. 8N114 TaxID=3457419 RepID=UPI003FD05CB7
MRARDSGDLLAFAEGRIGDADDDGNMNLVLRRSTDGGRTWGKLKVIWNAGKNKIGPGVPVVDQKSGDIVLLAIRTAGHVTAEDITTGRATWEESRRPFVLHSTDEGRSWSDPVEITGQVKPRTWRHFVFGPGHAIQLTRGKHAGRIVAPGNHTIAPPAGSGDSGREAKYHGVHLAYSDDGGRTWQLGATDADHGGEGVNGNESQLIELTDGTLYQSIRHQGRDAPSHRAYVLSSDGGASYDGPLRFEKQLQTAVVQGTVQRVFATDKGDDSDLILFSSAKETSSEGRGAMAIWRSTDEGKTWREAHTIWPARSAYSDMVKLSDEHIGLLYEGGENTPYEEISFARVPIAKLTP